MALKRKIDKAAWDKLDAAQKEFYVEKNGSYVLDLEGDDDEDGAGELRRANERLKQEAKDAKKALKELQDAQDDDATLDAKKKGDIEKLEKSWNDKVEKLTKDFTDKIAVKDAFIRETLVDSVASTLAREISNAPAVILPHIKARISADLDGEKPSTRILDKDGKPSAFTIDDLKKEFVANKDFSSIIVASKASGGATKANGQQDGGATKTQTDATKPLHTLSPADLAARIKERKEAATT